MGKFSIFCHNLSGTQKIKSVTHKQKLDGVDGTPTSKSIRSLSVRFSHHTFPSHGHIWGLEFNMFAFCFVAIRQFFSWDIANSIFDLENSRSRFLTFSLAPPFIDPLVLSDTQKYGSSISIGNPTCWYPKRYSASLESFSVSPLYGSAFVNGLDFFSCTLNTTSSPSWRSLRVSPCFKV